MPSLTLGGVPLCFDFMQEAQSFLDRFQDLNHLIQQPEAISTKTWQTNPVGKKTPIGLPLYNWPELPKPRVNQLVWPCTGATRFAYGIFLCTGEQRTQLLSLGCKTQFDLISTTSTNPPEPGTNGQDDVNCDFLARLWILQFHRVTGAKDAACDHNDTSVVTPQDLYLVLCVDDRFFWQFKSTQNMDNLITYDSECNITCYTWETLIPYLLNRVGYTGVQTYGIPAAYGVPNCLEMTRQYYNAAIMLDAATASIGSRLVANFDGSVKIQRPEESLALLSLNLARMKQQIAGFDCTSIAERNRPSSICVAFPKMLNGHFLCEPDYYQICNATGVPCGPPDMSKTIFSTAAADYGTDYCLSGYVPNGDPSNLYQIAPLAAQIAIDENAWREFHYDFTYASPRYWIPTGYDNYIIIEFGSEYYDGIFATTTIEHGQSENNAYTILDKQFRRAHQTRIQSLPVNVGVDSMLHESGATELPDDVLVQIKDCWEPDPCCTGNSSGENCQPTAMANPVYWCNCNWVPDTNVSIRVYSAMALPGDSVLKSRIAGMFCGSTSGESPKCLPISSGCSDKLWARWNCQTNRYEVTAKWEDTWRFELNDKLCKGGCAEATLLLACCDESTPTPSGITFIVCDENGLICQNKKCIFEENSSSAGECVSSTSGENDCVEAGTRGIARWMPDVCQFELIAIDQCNNQEELQYWSEITECILPGETGKGTLLTRDADGTFTQVCSEITIDNSECWGIAVPGDRVRLIAPQDCEAPDMWQPEGEFGLWQRVRVKDRVDCGTSGVGYLLKITCGSDSGGTSCTTEEVECDTITFCNLTGIPIGCGLGDDEESYEDIDVRLIPGNCCCVATSYSRPMNANGRVVENLCATTSSEIALEDMTYPTHCNWNGPTSGIANNPYGLEACAGSTVELRFNAEDCTWDIVQVNHYAVPVMLDMRFVTECISVGDTITACRIEKKQASISVMTCSCPVGGDWQTAIGLQVVDVMVPPQGSDSSTPPDCMCDLSEGLKFQKRSLCTFTGCGGDAASDVTINGETLKLTLVDVVTGVSTGMTTCGDPESSGGLSTCTFNFSSTKMCGIVCGEGPDIPGWTFHGESVITYIGESDGCLVPHVATIFSPCVCDEDVGSAIICTEPCSS